MKVLNRLLRQNASFNKYIERNRKKETKDGERRAQAMDGAKPRRKHCTLIFIITRIYL